MQGETACFAGEPSGQGEEASSQCLGGCHRLAQTEARGPACQVVSDDLYGQLGGVGGKRPEGRWYKVLGDHWLNVRGVSQLAIK